MSGSKEHPGSRDLYDRIANWEPGPLPFNKEFGWSRWGLLGVLADFVLYSTPGDIVEIGVCESSIFFSLLAKKYKRKVYHCDIQRSVIENCLTVPGYFDPDRSVIVRDSSDGFFEKTSLPPIALGFIDGAHTYENVKHDFENTLRHLVPDGYIFLHDTYPPDENWLGENSCGNVYLFRNEIERREDLDVFTFTSKNTAWGTGLTVVRKHPENLPFYRKRG